MAKLTYRQCISWHKCNGKDWDNGAVVEDIVMALDNEKLKKVAREGLRNIEHAVPIEPLHYEKPLEFNWADDMKVIHEALSEAASMQAQDSSVSE